ncbi:c-type cytochrome [Methylibium sp.]|uniref:c-type cytochrome n=1 Tax=Methylibium sp. TaxID=2067992 RepID=UPI003D111143
MSSCRESTRRAASSPTRSCGRRATAGVAGTVRTALAAAALLTLGGLGLAHAQATFPGIGRDATLKEVAAWDIDVRPDFKGLPPGSGSVAQGMDVWESKCASCHGVFGESNQTFSPLVGGTTAQDIRTGRVARLTDSAFPGRTTLMKVSTLSTLWDYINRAMPWTAPKSLKPDEVYAVTAYLLNLGGIVPDDLTLSDRNIADVQKLLPNRNGLTTDHGLWPGKGMGNGGKPDVKVAACMKDCAAEPKVASFLPDFARNAHGNLAEQNRSVGAQHGADTTRPPAATPAQARLTVAAATTAAPAPAPADSGAAAAMALTRKHTCVACHGVENKIVGPSFHDVAKKYGDRADAVSYLAGKIRSGGSGLWGSIPMPAQTLSEADARTIAQWLAAGAAK